IGWDFVDNDNDPTPNPGFNMGHGTHTMGVVAAKTNNVVGLAGMADIIIVDVRVSDSGLGPLVSAVEDALEWVVQQDACDIILMPFASLADPGYETEIDNAYNDGKLLVASAGNDWQHQVFYPAKYENVIAVSAVKNPKYGEGRWPTSNYGPEIELAAPGDDIVTTYYHTIAGDPPDYCGSDPPYDYARCDGTSLAAAHVAAIAGLVWSTCPKLSRDSVREILQSTAADWGAPGRDEHFGYGLVNVFEAVKVAKTRFEQSKAYRNDDRCEVLLHVPGVAMICDKPTSGNKVTIYSETTSVLVYALWSGSGSYVYNFLYGGSVDIQYPHYEDFIISIMTDEAMAPVGWLFCRENYHLSCRGIQKERWQDPYANLFDSNVDTLFFDPDKVTVSDTGDPAKLQLLEISAEAHDIFYSMWYHGYYSEGTISAHNSAEISFPDSTPFMLATMANYRHSPINWPPWGWISWLLCFETSNDMGCVNLLGERYVRLGLPPATDITDIPGFGGYREDDSNEYVEVFSDYYGVEYSIWEGSGGYSTDHISSHSSQRIYPPNEASILSVARHDVGMGWALCKPDPTSPFFDDVACAVLSPEEVPNERDVSSWELGPLGNPDVAIDHLDNVHVVWEEHRGEWDIHYKKLDNMGNTLIPDTDLITFPEDSFTDDQFGPVIAIGPDPADPTNPDIEIIYVIWVGEDSDSTYGVYLPQGKWAYIGAETTWYDFSVNAFVFLSDIETAPFDRSNKIDVVVDTSGNLHVLFTQYMYISSHVSHPNEKWQSLVHRWSADKGVSWSLSLGILDTGWKTPQPYDHLDWIRYPHMALSTIRSDDHRLFVVYSYDSNPIEVGTWDGHDTYVKFVVLWKLGPEWTMASTYNRGVTKNEAVYNDIVVNNPEAEAYVVWHYPKAVGYYDVRYSRNWRIVREYWHGTYYCEDSANCWDDDMDLVVPDISGESAEYPTIAVEPNNGLHVVWSDNEKDRANYEIMHTMSENGWDWDLNMYDLGWQISDASGPSSDPAIAVDSQGTTHMVWLDHEGWDWTIRYNRW
ncbi:MAG: S8 family serine peptidase, partial [Thermoplasmata archaeon]